MLGYNHKPSNWPEQNAIIALRWSRGLEEHSRRWYFWCDNVLRIVRIMFVFEWPWCHWPAQPTETQVVIIKTSNPGPWLFHIIFLIVECWVVWMTGPLCCIMAYWWCKTGDINYTKTVLSAPLPSSRHSCLWSGQVVNKTANTGPPSVRGVCG